MKKRKGRNDLEALIATLRQIAQSIQPLALPLGGLILAIIGFAYFLAHDPNKKQQLMGWIFNVAVGITIVYIAVSLVNWFGGLISKG